MREICEIVGISRTTYYKYTRGNKTAPEDTDRAAESGSPLACRDPRLFVLSEYNKVITRFPIR